MAGIVLRESVYQKLRDLIINGAITPGASLSEVALAAQFGVSRTPVREAIRRLAAEGFAEYTPHCGGKVIRPSPQLVREIFQIREALEGIAAREAALRIPSERLAEARARFERIRGAVERGDFSDVGDWLHEEMIQSSANSRLMQLVSVYREQVAWLQRLVAEVPGRLQSAFREHESILSALESRDPDWAESVARAHVRRTLADLMKSIESVRPRDRRRRNNDGSRPTEASG